MCDGNGKLVKKTKYLNFIVIDYVLFSLLTFVLREKKELNQ